MAAFPLVVGESYTVEENFVGEDTAELSVTIGQVVTVLESESPENAGWILVSSGSQSGYVPSAYLGRPQSQPSNAAQSNPFDAPPPAIDAVSAVPPPAIDAISAAPPPAIDAVSAAPPPAIGAVTGFGLDDFNVNDVAAPPPAIGSYADNLVMQQPPPVTVTTSAAPVPDLPSQYWVTRDTDLLFVHYPTIAQRRWFYRDIFSDIQGPFNAQEMLQRIQARHIKGNTSVLAETGSGAASSFYEDTLSSMFPDMSKVFQQPPLLPMKGEDPLWYFVDAQRCEQGPFSSEQMKFWLDQGFFSAETTLRRADGSSQRMALFKFFNDPALAFPYEGQENVPLPPSAEDVNPKVLNRGTSGKELLAAAFGPAVAMPASAPAPPPTLGLEGKDDVEKFDKVHMSDGLDTETKDFETEKNKEENEKFNVYGGGWNEYTGVPNPKVITVQKQYAAALYTFATRPLHPDAGTIQCYIRRDIDGTHINFSKYIVFLEDTKVPIMAAYRYRNLGSSYYEIKLNTTGKTADAAHGLTIARLEVNFSGTDFLLHNAVSGHTGSSKDLGCAVYQRSRGPGSTKGPRKMKCAIPEVRVDKPEFAEWRHKGKSSEMQAALKSLQVEKGLIPLLNKPPTWNAKKRAYTLGFKGRVKISSVKNFQLVDALRDPKHQHVLMQHGRVNQVQFSMDTHHPLSLLQSFAFALSSLHAKKFVD